MIVKQINPHKMKPPMYLNVYRGLVNYWSFLGQENYTDKIRNIQRRFRSYRCMFLIETRQSKNLPFRSHLNTKNAEENSLLVQVASKYFSMLIQVWYRFRSYDRQQLKKIHRIKFKLIRKKATKIPFLSLKILSFNCNFKLSNCRWASFNFDETL